ncbi:uncharacterized protein LOC62_06G008137 [Vanrija pseudolonga]|uniref:Uncharacterized protein n=1 Tax=Vanrija pseudolonga TaxID=143232 RepID=A0AAF0YD98_9TREE|nr:hypothetical protein LOC62_06G008137 [Vanrija pseudolonga]
MADPAARTNSLGSKDSGSPGDPTPPPSLAQCPLLTNEYVNSNVAGLLLGLYKHVKLRLAAGHSASERIKELYDRAVVLVEDYWPEIVRGLGLPYTDDDVLVTAMRFVASDRPRPSSGSRMPSLLVAYLTPEEAAASEAPQWAQRGLTYERPLLLALFYLIGGAKTRAFGAVDSPDLLVVNRPNPDPERAVARARILSVLNAQLDSLRGRILFLCTLPETASSAAAFRREIDQFVRDRRAAAAEEAPPPPAA